MLNLESMRILTQQAIGETAKHKAEDLNSMFLDKEIDRYFLCNGWV